MPNSDALINSLIERQLKKQQASPLGDMNPLTSQSITPNVANIPTNFATASNPIGGMNAGISNIFSGLTNQYVRADQEKQALVDAANLSEQNRIAAANQDEAWKRKEAARLQQQGFTAAQNTLDREARSADARAPKQETALSKLQAKKLKRQFETEDSNLVKDQKVKALVEDLQKNRVSPSDTKAIEASLESADIPRSKLGDVVGSLKSFRKDVIGDDSIFNTQHQNFVQDTRAEIQGFFGAKQQQMDEELKRQGILPESLRDNVEMKDTDLTPVVKDLTAELEEGEGLLDADTDKILPLAKKMLSMGNGKFNADLLKTFVLSNSDGIFSSDGEGALQAFDQFLAQNGYGNSPDAKLKREQIQGYQVFQNTINTEQAQAMRELEEYGTARGKARLQNLYQGRPTTDIGSAGDVGFRSRLKDTYGQPLNFAAQQAPQSVPTPTEAVPVAPQVNNISPVINSNNRLQDRGNTLQRRGSYSSSNSRQNLPQMLEAARAQALQADQAHLNRLLNKAEKGKLTYRESRALGSLERRLTDS